MSYRQLWEGGDGHSFLMRLDGRTKLSFLFCYALMMIIVDNARTLFFLFTLTLVFHFLGKTPFYKWRVLAIFILLGLWGSIASQALFFSQNPRTPLVTLISPGFPVLGALTNGLYIYREGIIYGAIQGMRTVSMITLGLLVCWTSDPRQLLKGLTSWNLSPQAAFMLVTAIRFFPVLAAEAGEVMVALQLRSGSEKGRHQVLMHIPHKGRKAEIWRPSEKWVCTAFFLFTLACGSAKILYALSKEGFYYGALRMVYDCAKMYL